MKELDFFKQIYNYEVLFSREVATINEIEPQALLNRLEIVGNGIGFHVIPNYFSKCMASDKLVSSPCHKDADGIILFERSGEKYVLVCELKSSSGQLSCAMKQVVSSYLNFCEAFMLCDGFDIEQFHVIFIITAVCDGKYLDWLNDVSMKQKTMSLTFFEDIVWQNYNGNVHTGSKLSDFTMYNLPKCLNSKFIDKGVSIAFCTAPMGNNMVKIDVEDLL